MRGTLVMDEATRPHLFGTRPATEQIRLMQILH